jgi:hypothetical protein
MLQVCILGELFVDSRSDAERIGQGEWGDGNRYGRDATGWCSLACYLTNVRRRHSTDGSVDLISGVWSLKIADIIEYMRHSDLNLILH